MERSSYARRSARLVRSLSVVWRNRLSLYNGQFSASASSDTVEVPLLLPFVTSEEESSLYTYAHVFNKNEWNKWKNHFCKMKGDVGMSHHEKGGNKKMPAPRQKVIHNPIPTSLLAKAVYDMYTCMLAHKM